MHQVGATCFEKNKNTLILLEKNKWALSLLKIKKCTLGNQIAIRICHEMIQMPELLGACGPQTPAIHSLLLIGNLAMYSTLDFQQTLLKPTISQDDHGMSGWHFAVQYILRLCRHVI